MSQIILDNLRRARLNGQLYSFLVGTEGFAISCSYADVPTDPTVVMSTITKLYETDLDSSIWSEFESNLILMSKDRIYGWLSLYYLLSYLYYRRSRKHDFIKLNNVIEEIEISLKHNRAYLSQLKQWGGSAWPDGLWGDVRRMATNINEEFELNLSFS